MCFLKTEWRDVGGQAVTKAAEQIAPTDLCRRSVPLNSDVMELTILLFIKGFVMRLLLVCIFAWVLSSCATNSQYGGAAEINKTAWAGTSPIHIPVRDNGLVGVLVVPDTDKTYPGVLRIGGAEGGVSTSDADTIAAGGYAVLALAYFGTENLPVDLEEVPLEYFGKAIEWMKHSTFVDSKRLGIVGVSRGSILALMLPTIYDDFAAVVALAPSHVVWQSSYLDWNRYAEKSSLSYHGQPLPFVPYDFSNESASAGCNQEGNCAAMYDFSLGQVERVEESLIPVERIAAPILLVSGEEDTLWPATRMSSLIVQRLADRKFSYEVRDIAYANAGHCAMNNCYGGGTPVGNQLAREELRREVMEFLDRHLKQNTNRTSNVP